MNSQLTRRELLERAALGGAALSLPGLLAACGGEEEKAVTTAPAKKLADTLTISNWPLYIDIDEKTKKRPTLEQFQQKFGVKVKYIEDVNDNEEFFGKIQGPLSQGQSIERDIIVLTDWMAARLVRLGWLEKLDKSAIPNAKNLVDALEHPGWDPNRDYSLPWQSGMTGIGYDPKQVGRELTSIDELLEDPKLKGKVTLLSEMPDAIGLTLLSSGEDPTKVTPAAFDKAIAKLKKAVDSGQIRQFTGNEYAGMLAKGDVWAAMAWSGDVIQLQADNPNLRFVIPDAGGMIWSDNMLIPRGGDVFTASTFMNYVYDPKVEAQIEAYVNYISPVEGTREAIKAIDPALAKNELIFPSQETLSRVHIFDAEAADKKELKEKFQALIGA